MSKASSRIPTFRSKGPQPKAPSLKPVLAPTSKDIGKKVKVVDKEGTLRYVGNVHFSNGVWCGVELSKSLGKNDGVVNGIRYFACPQSCGLMAPLSKVSLIVESDYENLNQEDGFSGPYSMLFIGQKDNTYTKDESLDETLVSHDSTKRRTFTVNNDNETLTNQDTYVLELGKENQTFNKESDRTIHKSCENLFNDSCVEVKRRRTASKIDNTPISVLNNIEKPSSLPQLRSAQNFTSFEFNSPQLSLNKFSHSTPVRTEFEESLLRKLQLTSANVVDDDSSKRDSLEFEESLGILTPEQMIDGMSFMSVINSRTPSSECIGELKEKSDLPSPSNSNNNPPIVKTDDLPSPNVVTDLSLGIIDEQLLSNLTQRTDTTMNMELPLDTIDKSKDFTLTRLEQTPSPEDLPLDPTPIVESDPKTEPSKSKTSSSFITSITSITSLDTGYQGDGEMSRPASRGADNSPLTRRPLPRPQTRRPDPMTDSDFYTESDADNHEENPLRGDRRAQVIDGTLYGVDPQAAADIYVNNRENMDSSGIFTDIESSNTRNDEDVQNVNNNITVDVSPSDTSSKTISGNSQNNIQEILEKNLGDEKEKSSVQKENPKKRNASSPAISSPASVRSPRHLKDDNSKKFKMPKREVTSKVKAMLESTQQKTDKKSSVKKPAGRWDAVMNKISKTESKTNLKDVKSKVFNSVNVGGNAQRQGETRKTSPRQVANQKTANVKQRRIRTRTGNTTSPKINVESSIHSSFSDLSASGTSPKSAAGSAKKREVVQVTQVLTASKLSSPRNVQQHATTPENNKKATPNSTPVESKFKRSPLVSKEKKQTSATKECGRTTVKGGRTSPVVRPPVHTRAPAKPVPRVAEALAVLVQHLVFNVEAYQVPALKREVQKFRHEAEEIRVACQHLEEALADERAKKTKALEEEREKCANEVSVLVANHKSQILELNKQQYELEQRLLEENEETKTSLAKQNEEKLKTLKIEFQRLQKTHEESLDILREENDAIREQIDEKNAEIEEIRHESLKLKEDYEAKEMKLKEQLQNVKSENQKLKQELSQFEEKFESKLRALQEENDRLREENDRFLNYSDNKAIGVQEVHSLRAVLELKQNEVAELRRALAEATQKNESLSGAEEKAAALSARCEDLQHQLQRKSEYEQNLLVENKKLYDSFKEEINQKKRLCQYNEELQWKLKQNKEVVTKVLEQAAEESSFNRSLLSASFSERHNSIKQNLERTLSFREPKNNSWSKSKTEEISPPTSPKVKGVVEKSDWVSYVLDLDESPDIVASRIVRRSFRNSTPPKTTPTKSPSSKRPRMKNPLSLSASASAILPPNKVEYARSRSLSTRNGEELEVDWVTSTPKRNDDDLDLDEDELDLKLPALPSEIGRKNGAQALPSPKHLAGEAMISESNSEDESTSSSSVQL